MKKDRRFFHSPAARFPPKACPCGRPAVVILETFTARGRRSYYRCRACGEKAGAK